MLGDLVVPVAVISILASLLLPLPASVLDVLLIINLLLSLVLLASSLYISDPLKLSSLPSMLLLGTLFRLALNVSTTRMILNSAEAGRVIQAFGEVVIQGNLVVGVAVFVIITVIQFMVIARGAERVAEVSARFTLDALPGKQMSIDADVRAGLIDFEAARSKRQDLQTESRFYGALDGAMKFIKGDAIAGIIIVAVNIVGGLTVGLAMHGLTPGTAVSVYTLLTVGDGLVSQVPALLNALAAAIVVTRVSKGDGQSLASELPHQLGQLRSVKFIVAALSMLLGLIPHMPLLPFAAIAAGMILSAWGSSSGSKEAAASSTSFQPRSPAPLSIELSAAAGAQLRACGGFPEAVDDFRNRIFQRTGIILAIPELAPVPASDSFRILVRGVEAVRQALPPGADLSSTLILALDRTVTTRLPEFIDDVLTRRSLDYLEREAPELVAAVVPSVISITQLSEILRALAAENVSIRNLDMILQAVAERGAKTRNERELLEDVRVALRRVITAQFQDEAGKIECVALAPAYDTALQRAEREGLILSGSILDSLRRDLQAWHGAETILVCSKGARRMLRDLSQGIGRSFRVVAYEEIQNDEETLVYRAILGSQESQHEVVEALAA